MPIDELTSEVPETMLQGGLSPNGHAPRRRFIFLLGTARSGTTWLGNILNSSPRSVYSHEPLMRFPGEQIEHLLQQIKQTGQLSADEREAVLDHWSRAYFAVRRPPFFAKDYSHWPAKVMWGAWLALTVGNRGYRLFQHAFSPSDVASYDLVAKQGLAAHARQFVDALAPDGLIVIIRHPCAVIASVRRGRRLKLMREHKRAGWLDEHLPLCEQIGYGAARVEAMTDLQFESLCWLMENTVYLQLADEHPNAHTVVYRDLCNDPMEITQTLFDALGWKVTQQTRRFLHDTTVRQSTRLMSLVTASHSYFSVYRPARDSINAWKHELSRREQEEILEIAQPLLDRYWPEQLNVAE